MAITSFSELKTTISEYLARDDSDADAELFIQLIESEINRDLSLKEMVVETTLTVTSGSGFVTLPTDFLEIESIRIAGNQPALEQFEYDDILTRNMAIQSGTPRAFAMYDSTRIILSPTPNAGNTLTLLYYQKIPALSTSQTTNWLLTKDPEAYLYGALSKAGPKYQDNDDVVTKGALWAGVKQGLKEQDMRRRMQKGGVRRYPVKQNYTNQKY